MISSVIANLRPTAQSECAGNTIELIRARAGFEVGELIAERKLPVTIEADDSFAMIDATRWLQSCEGVEFVDVVFVHFDEKQ